ncbi:Uncharacterised protein [uncultured archaeon]|nr:Uncharacterised protein [uncultured archaeon]
MSDHLLWVEIKDNVAPRTLHRAYCFFGHPSVASSLYAPLMDEAYLLIPKGEKIGLELQKGSWLPGYGHAEHLFADIMFFWQGDYRFVSIRSPGVYDLGWHGARSDPFLSINYAKAVIHAGDGPNRNWDAGLPLELIPDRAPYALEAGEEVNINVKFLGQPVRASCTASYWTWDEHGDKRVQRGDAEENGDFCVKLSQGGLWFVDAAYSLPEPGIWKATHSLANFFKSGDMLPYNTKRYKTTLSLWVR